jgi:hypothetical protein
VVAAGVAEALVTTAAGLIIAVPSVLLFNHFNRRMNIMLTVSENHTRSLRVALAEVTEGSKEVAAAGSRTTVEKSAAPADAEEQASRETVSSLFG